jgi:hypothetical protein
MTAMQSTQHDPMVEKPMVPRIYKALSVLWLLLILPWIVIAPLSAMMFDAPPTIGVYVGFWTILTYPVPVGIAALLRKRAPAIVLLPLLNFAVFGILVVTEKWN